MSNPTFGYLASLVPALKTREVLHTAPSGKVVEGKIAITHRDSYPIRVRIGVSSGGITDFNPENYKRPIKLSYDLIDSKSNKT